LKKEARPVTIAIKSPETVGMSTSRLKLIKPAMQAHVDRGVFAGVSTLIARRGKIVHSEQFGWRDKEAGAPMTADTIFRLYSMTKPIICVGLMTLIEEARCTLFDPLAKYVPAFGKVKVLEADGSLVDPVRPIRLGDLMSHMSGLSYHFVGDSPVETMAQGAKLLEAKVPLEAAIDDLARFPLAFQPGSQWRYSVGIDVVARVIEVISGKPLGAFLRERLFDPLGMADFGFGVPPEKRNRVAAMHGRPDVFAASTTIRSSYEAWAKGANDRLDVSQSYPVDAPDVFMRGGHGLFGTIGDYYRFAQMLANGGTLDGNRVLGRKTVQLMHLNRVPAALLPLEIGGLPLPGYGFGLGSRVLLDVAQSGAPGSVGEFGWSGAAKTHYWVDPQEELVGLFMTQSMMSFDLPEVELRALAYQAIDD
jgi:CubicO group peptidase (beta-lactamase class C family)